MRPGLRAGLHERESVALVGADGGRDGAGALRDRGERGGVLGVGDEQRPVGGARAELAAGLRELGLAAAAEPDPRALRRVLGEVAGGELADEAGGSVQDDVEVTFGGHVAGR